MAKKCVAPTSLFSSVEHGFSQVVIGSGARTVFISGQTAWDRNKQIVGKTSAEQTRQALHNVQAAVEAAGGTLNDVVALRIYSVRLAESVKEIGSALRETFPNNPPVSTWIGVTALAAPEFLIEIEATAVLE